jgi:hypothetical protein
MYPAKRMNMLTTVESEKRGRKGERERGREGERETYVHIEMHA